ncbi:hypothetical protein W04_1089 [Pseudoalteromonas sp. SW0106-04]|uniref:hypothetical protein n=1 Tax=Pseudoalteromonas sp. SW0106-04 TaxID=1702169 RepID=UPI0006B68B6F|nr:hypothetical protein [Pseudoalteromonas sp. SW0106-04]GAP74573.1 hypothetical protein W04_1089 [Pseudoalteromonas sp. SW0106-04]
MKGIYLNCDSNHALKHFPEWSKYSQRVSGAYAGQKYELIYDKMEWRQPPIIEFDDALWVLYGWFIVDGKKNDLQYLLRQLAKHGVTFLQQLTAGSFVLVKINSDGVSVMVDPLGLSTHYYQVSEGQLQVSPTLSVFENKIQDTVLTEALRVQGHLFGDYTKYKGVYRLSPGSHTTSSSVEYYYHHSCNSSYALEEVPQLISELTSYWTREQSAIGLSGGLDSRLILACGQFDYAFTYGPESSGDRPIARQFKKEVARYDEFSYLEPPKLPYEELAYEVMFDGSSSPVYRLLSAYSHARNESGNAHVFFDGYLGDVLQRGAYLKTPGLLGELLHLFPKLYDTFGFSAETLLLQRYRKLSSEAKSLLIDDFRSKVKCIASDDPYTQLTFYEFLYGRGGRYIINGGNISCGQFFTVVPVFSELRVFNCFMSQSLLEAARYRNLKLIWKHVPSRFKKVKTESGINPDTKPLLIPFVHFCHRFYTHFLSSGNYGREIKKAQKNRV